MPIRREQIGIRRNVDEQPLRSIPRPLLHTPLVAWTQTIWAGLGVAAIFLVLTAVVGAIWIRPQAEPIRISEEDGVGSEGRGTRG